MFPLKWKIFRVICHLQIAAVTGCLLLHVIFRWQTMFSDFREIIYNPIFISALAILLAKTLRRNYQAGIENFLSSENP